MNTHAIQKSSINLSVGSRIARVVFGAVLIAGAMTSSQTPLGLLAVLPLLAIYPIFTGLTGWEPIKELCQAERISQCLLHLPTKARMIIGAIGIAMIGSVFMVSGAPGWLILLPLLAVYPVFIAVMGEEPVTAIYNIDTSLYGAKSQPEPQPELTVSEVNESKQVEIASQVEDHHDLAA